MGLLPFDRLAYEHERRNAPFSDKYRRFSCFNANALIYVHTQMNIWFRIRLVSFSLKRIISA
jgi:hypothetical protein